MNKKIKNLIFDLGGVIVDLDRQATIDAYNELGFTEADNLLSNYLQKGIFRELEKGTATPEELYNYIRDTTGRDISDEASNQALNRFITGLEPYKLQMLRELRKKFNVYLLSNTNAIMIPVIDRKWFRQEGLEMKDYFDKMYLSYEMKMLKPDPGIFEAVLRDAGIRAEESLFLDDGEANVETARKLGFHTYQPLPGEDYRHIFEEL